jgi:hypothetical protein
MTDDNVTYLSAAHVPDRGDRDWVTSAELITESGITYRQCDYWCRTGLLHTLEDPTPGSGWMRRFPDAQIRRAHLIHELLDSGMTLTTVRTVIDEITETGTVRIGVLTITVQGGDAA